MFKKIALVCLALLITGCATHGNKIDESAVSKLKKGQTTEEQVITMLGKPTSSGFSSDGSKMLTFSYANASANPISFIPYVGMFFSSTDVESQVLYVTLNKSGKVSDYSYSSSESEVKTGLL
ncbi:outer membrane protein assembly factor BamE [Shewanella sp. 1CM18E]|uniref:outer membrane protein assembly factor BamE domain-containing protein n=1 Tax=Shewanella sp. 1CM18E TaxID=2929169 RepID=UPI0020BE3430|nr:outer membrane protein assembly factor BamE [Shewanella sp. 1CM18E]MCK8045130.1 outer membrane protein assembly factor BamE [Shewanella sp. 1CM18E]